MKAASILAIALFALSTSAQTALLPSEIHKNNLLKALQDSMMPGSAVKEITNYDDDSISFVVSDPTSTAKEVKVDAFSCSLRSTGGGRDLLIPACSGSRTINGKSDTSHSKPTLADITKRGENSIRFKSLLDVSNKNDQTNLGDASGMDSEIARQCLLDQTCTSYMQSRFGKGGVGIKNMPAPTESNPDAGK